MTRKHEPSSISRLLQRNPAWSQVACVVGIALLVILGPVLLYGLLFRSGLDSVRMLSSIPWWPVVILVALVALLSLLHGTTGVSVEKRSEKKKDAATAADLEDQDGPVDPSTSSPPGPPGTANSSGPPGKNSDPVRCTMHERTMNRLSGVDTKR